jgi:hypothetical protein
VNFFDRLHKKGLALLKFFPFYVPENKETEIQSYPSEDEQCGEHDEHRKVQRDFRSCDEFKGGGISFRQVSEVLCFTYARM